MKEKLLLPILGLITAGTMLIPAISMAQSTATTTQINSISTLLQQLQTLRKQIDDLKASQQTLQTQVATEFNAFIVTLSLGSQGDAVKALQALLAANPDIYPEGLITGFFGKATERALKRLQRVNGLEQIGRVGPRTRQLLNRLLRENSIAFEDDDDGDESGNRGNDGSNRGHGGRGENKRPCAIVPPGHLIASGWLKKHDGNRLIVPVCQTLPGGIERKLDDDEDDDDDDDNQRSTTTPDIIAPIISNLVATSTTSSVASVVWSTDEKTTSTLWYSTTTPLNTSSAIRLDNNSRKTSHSYTLTGLTASTTYYYLVNVSDKSHNSATTTEHSFITLTN
ncbi:MAG: peptidoglycan-binding protein [bacterium]|nr:peptidoglycan-binding protein [bacterium]